MQGSRALRRRKKDATYRSGLDGQGVKGSDKKTGSYEWKKADSAGNSWRRARTKNKPISGKMKRTRGGTRRTPRIGRMNPNADRKRAKSGMGRSFIIEGTRGERFEGVPEKWKTSRLSMITGF